MGSSWAWKRREHLVGHGEEAPGPTRLPVPPKAAVSAQAPVPGSRCHCCPEPAVRRSRCLHHHPRETALPAQARAAHASSRSVRPGNIAPSTGSIPFPSLASLNPYIEQPCAPAPASSESLSVDKRTAPSECRGRSTWTHEQDSQPGHSGGLRAGSVQAQGCVSSLGGLRGGSSSSSHTPTNDSEILGQ